MVITIEPVFTLGTEGAVLWGDDGWTISTADGSWGAQYEHTIAITKNGPYILTS
jgi:methionyl aminopeptidase